MINQEYAEINKKMDMWRSGFIEFPRDYIDYHMLLASKATAELEASGWVIHSSCLQSDGWLDGMKVVNLVVESPKGVLVKLVWHDSHDKGYWMEKYQGHGGAGSFNQTAHEGKNASQV